MMITPVLPLVLLVAISASRAAAFPNDNSARYSGSNTSTGASSSTTEAPTPWVSIYPDGSASTFTEHIITSNGHRTTVDVQPTGSSVPDSSHSHDVFAQCDSDHYELTSKGNTRPWVPFCAPHNDTKWWHTGKYYVTWNPNFWEKNSTVTIMLHYLNYGGAGELADSWQVPNYLGFHPISPSKDWLKNQTALDEGVKREVTEQPMAFSMVGSDSASGNGVQEGPTVIITSDPKAKPVSPIQRPPVSTLGLAVGLPVVFVFIVGTLCCLHFCMSHKRKVGPMSIGGGRRHFVGRGYTGRKERRRKTATAYRDDVADVSPVDNGGNAWELANIKGGN